MSFKSIVIGVMYLVSDAANGLDLIIYKSGLFILKASI